LSSCQGIDASTSSCSFVIFPDSAEIAASGISALRSELAGLFQDRLPFMRVKIAHLRARSLSQARPTNTDTPKSSTTQAPRPRHLPSPVASSQHPPRRARPRCEDVLPSTRQPGPPVSSRPCPYPEHIGSKARRLPLSVTPTRSAHFAGQGPPPPTSLLAPLPANALFRRVKRILVHCRNFLPSSEPQFPVLDAN
jgi:hypothetical protein